MKDQMRLMKQLQEMQTRMTRAQAELEDETVEATAGGGVVKAVVTGSQKLRSVSIDPEVAGDVEMLQDLVVAAVNDGLERSRELAAGKMQQLTGGLGLPPGLI